MWSTADVLPVLLAALAVVLLGWVALILAARRLPPGLLRDIAEFLPACVAVARKLRTHPAVTGRVRLVLGLAALWVLSPIDLIPEFLPVIGPLDDVVVVVLALRYAARAIPRAAVFEAWPASPRLLERVLDGRRRTVPAGSP